MPKKTVVSNFNAIDNNEFKNFLSNLAEFFLVKLPDPSKKVKPRIPISLLSEFRYP